jgi:hypothetical protein
MAAGHCEMHIPVIFNSNTRNGIASEFESFHNAVFTAVCKGAPIFA